MVQFLCSNCSVYSKTLKFYDKIFQQTRYSDRFHDFSVTIPKCYKDVYVNSFFPGTARPWNSLPVECFPMTYDLNGFKSRIY